MEVDTRWKHPTSLYLVGPSGSGKTYLLDKILANKDELFMVKGGKIIKNVILCYAAWQDYYDNWIGKRLVNKTYMGFPNLESIEENAKKFRDFGGTLLLLDDLAPQMGLKDITALQTILSVISHHQNLSVVYIGHNIFHKNMRECSLQFHKYLLTNNFRDQNQISYLGKQMYPENARFIPAVYKDVLKTPYNNLLLDFSPYIDPSMRVTASWFNKDRPIDVYKPSDLL